MQTDLINAIGISTIAAAMRIYCYVDRRSTLGFRQVTG
jgi:hypothetical protein